MIRLLTIVAIFISAACSQQHAAVHPTQEPTPDLPIKHAIVTAQNLVVSLERSTGTVSGESICTGASTGFGLFQQKFVSADECHFSGRLSANMPLREFQMKVIQMPESTDFLLASCSNEQRIPSDNACEIVLSSFKALPLKK